MSTNLHHTAGPWSVTVPGEPFPMPRPRAGRTRSGRPVIHEDDRAAPARAAISMLVRAHWGVDKPGLEGGVACFILFVMQRPKSVKRSQPYVKPDLDNLAKTVLDGITQAGKERVVTGKAGLVTCGAPWTDDGQVVSLTCVKRYADDGEQPHTHITVIPCVVIPEPSPLGIASLYVAPS